MGFKHDQNQKRAIKCLVIAPALVALCAAACTKQGSQIGGTVDPTMGTQPLLAQSRSLDEAKLVRSDYAPGELTILCDAALGRAKGLVDAVALEKPQNRTPKSTLLSFEETMADLSDDTAPLTFMGYVSTDTKVSAEASACDEKLSQFYVDTFTRRDVYQAIEALKSQTGRSADEQRLLDKTLEGFEQNGLKLGDTELAQVKALMSELSTKETLFAKNLNNDTTTVTLSEQELQGVPADFIAGLQKSADGKRIVSTKSTDYVTVMQNAADSSARQKMQLAYLNRAVAAGNTQLIQDAVLLRSKIAKLLGYATWADYKAVTRMAKSKQNIEDFLGSLRQKLAERNKQDLQQLLVFQKESNPTATKLDQWDVPYLAYQLQKRDYSLDNEKIREYFPADVVIAGMFKVYSEMLGVSFKEVVGAKTWAPDVKLYEIHDVTDDRLIALFYTDFNPRDGKYGHAAAFTLIGGRQQPDGTYNIPISSIVANFTPPQNGKPSLLLHDEVETIFHEFGHIMHQTLTRATYQSLSGSGVARDFVEAPSQMLENWVWSPAILTSLSGHYLDHSQKLPKAMLDQMLAAKDFQQGYGYTKQLLYGLYDMKLHTSPDGLIDVTKEFDDLYKEVVGQEALPGGHFAANFGHLMGGYDAGYYGYLWSEVYAQDMFSIFSPDDLSSPKQGMRYRHIILERGNMQDSIELLKEFLGREPNSDAFFKKLGISK